MSNEIRDLRESKGLSQTAAAEVCGLTFSRYERIEMGSPRTTEDEIAHVKKALRATKKTGKKLVGRPFSDPEKQRAVEEARAKGESVAAVLAQLAAARKPQEDKKVIASESIAQTKSPSKKTPRTRSKATKEDSLV